MLANLSIDDLPTPEWIILVSKSLLRLVLNTINVRKNSGSLPDIYLRILKSFRNRNPTTKMLEPLLEILDSERIDGSGDSFEEYNDLFKNIAIPKISETFLEDSEFARMRVAGPNPIVIKGISNLPNNFQVSEEGFSSVVPNDTLINALKEGRVYLADYDVLKDVENGKFPDKQKYLYAPLALFVVPKDGTSPHPLLPVAIQCGQDADSHPIIFPPAQGATDPKRWAWNIAKTIVQIADANYHELITHLGLTHLLIEPFAIATERQLASAHPLGILLRAHFEGTFFINDLAHRFLIGERDPVDALLAGTYKASQKVAADAVKKFKFNDSFLRDSFNKRDTTKLPYYPYRDDALLIWGAIHEWVSDYLLAYYKKNNNIVLNDTELQEWAKELISTKGGNIQEFGEKGLIKTFDYLVKVTTQVIFTASVQHAAVNFPQASIMSYTPAFPLAGYIPIPSNFKAVSEKDFFNLLPSIKQAQGQLGVTYLLGSVYYTKLGNYSNIVDPEVQEPLRKFQLKLKSIEAQINERNLSSSEEFYEYLLPSRIPQSINI